MPKLDKPPVLIFILDTLRPDFLAHEIGAELTPNLRDFASQSYTFNRAYSPSNWTLPSHASLFTGLQPRNHSAKPPNMQLERSVQTLAEVFTDSGYRTACITCNPFLSGKFGMTRGFEIVRKVASIATGINRVSDFLFRQSRERNTLTGAALRTAQLLATIARSTPKTDNGLRGAIRHLYRTTMKPGPWFAVVNLMETHEPYHGRGVYSSIRRRINNVDVFGDSRRLSLAANSGRKRVDRRLRSTLEEVYWANASYLDRRLGSLVLAEIEERFEKGYIILLSDHGQYLGERNRIGHLLGLHEEVVRVPLLIRPPGGVEGEAIDRPICITSLFDLLVRIARGQENPFRDWLRTVHDEDPVVIESFGGIIPHLIRPRGRDSQELEDIISYKNKHDFPSLACIVGSWKLICQLGRAEDELYDLENDHEERINLQDAKGGLSLHLHRILVANGQGGTPEQPVQRRRDQLSLNAKIKISEIVIREALQPNRRTALAWWGGVDDGVVLQLCVKVSGTSGLCPPSILFIDHGQHAPETMDFIERVIERDELEVLLVRNDNILGVMKGSDTVSLEDLDSETQREALKAGVQSTEFSLNPHDSIGTYLLKTVPLRDAIEEHRFDTVISGNRWSEMDTQIGSVFFSQRENPPHVRVHPTLTWTDRDVGLFIGNQSVSLPPP